MKKLVGINQICDCLGIHPKKFQRWRKKYSHIPCPLIPTREGKPPHEKRYLVTTEEWIWTWWFQVNEAAQGKPPNYVKMSLPDDPSSLSHL